MAGTPPVSRLLLLLTRRCNLSCAYCYRPARKSASVRWGAIQSAIGTALRGTSRLIDIAFSGGEPLLEFGLLRRAVEYAERVAAPGKRIRFSIGTNGLLLSDEVADFLTLHDFTVQLSFDGVARAQDVRGARTFEILDRLLESLPISHPQLFRHRLRVAMTVTPPTVRYVADSVRYFIDRGVRDLIVAHCLNPPPGWDHLQMQLLEAQIAGVADMSRFHLDRTGEVPVAFLRKRSAMRPGAAGTRELCAGLSGSGLVVDAGGEAFGCPLFAEAGSRPGPIPNPPGADSLGMGDVRAGDFAARRSAAIRQARRMSPPDEDVRRHSSYGRCGDCRYLGECAVCPVSLWGSEADTAGPRVPDFICAFNQVTLKHRELFPALPGAFQALQSPDGFDPIERLEAFLRAEGEA